MPPSRPAWLWWMFAGTIVLSAFLLFLVQPLIAKILLPWFGGSTGVWATCVVFFQVMLVFGYAYAHALTTYLTPKQQMLTHLALLGLAVLAAGWSIMPGDSWRPENSDLPILKLGLLLLRYVGLPYFALATTGPLVQAWFARLFPGKTPYRLYALSNFGSLASLLLFPTVFEQFFGLRLMSTGWSLLFAMFAALAAGVAYLTWREAPHPISAVPASATDVVEEQNSKGQNRKQVKLKRNELPTSEAAAEPTWGSYLLWLALPAFASYMLVAGTNHLCQDVASVPFLWVMPLSLYLISFIICFDHEYWYQRLVFAAIALAGLYMSAGMYQLDFEPTLSQGLLVRGTWPVTRPLYESMDWYNHPTRKHEIPNYQQWLAELEKTKKEQHDKTPLVQADLPAMYQDYVKVKDQERYDAWLAAEKEVDPLVKANLESTEYIKKKYKAWLQQRANINWLENEQHVPLLNVNFIGQILAHCVGLFGLFMICHGELTRRKPPARYLTSFYMMIAIGGAIGGALVSLAAPFVFDTYAEWFLGLILALLLVGGLLLDQPGGEWYKSRFFCLALPAALVSLYVIWKISNLPEEYLNWADPEAYQKYLEEKKGVAALKEVSLPEGKLFGLHYALPLMGLLFAIIGIGFYALWERAWQRDKLRFWVVNLSMLLLVCFAVWDGLNFLELIRDAEGQEKANWSLYKDLPPIPFDSDESYQQLMASAREIRSQNTNGAEEDEDDPFYEKKIFQGRNFYGALSVHEQIHLINPEYSFRYLMHGRILHGNQFLEGPLRYQPTSYYPTDSGVGLAIGHFGRTNKLELDEVKFGNPNYVAYAAFIASKIGFTSKLSLVVKSPAFTAMFIANNVCLASKVSFFFYESQRNINLDLEKFLAESAAPASYAAYIASNVGLASRLGLAASEARRDRKLSLEEFKVMFLKPATYGAFLTTNIGLAIADKMHIGAIGLGTGTIAAYGKQPGQQFTIYEINPLVEQLSATDDGFFKYISDAKKQFGCLVKIVLGDARLQMQLEADAGIKRNFDVLVVDAFSGDSIPTHLLTREAMDTYVKHMRSDQSIIAIHITNRYLNLRPVCRGLAEYAKLDGCIVRNERKDNGCSPSTWVLLTNNRVFLDQTVPSVGFNYGPLFNKKIDRILWTDDFTTLINILHGTGGKPEEDSEDEAVEDD